jgi:hypothetical protein
VNLRSIVVALPLALLASQALAETWIPIADTGIRVDRDTMLRGNDGLIYFTDNIRMSGDSTGVTEKLAMDCSRHWTFVLRPDGTLSAGSAIEANSIEDAEFKYVCGNLP